MQPHKEELMQLPLSSFELYRNEVLLNAPAQSFVKDDVIQRARFGDAAAREEIITSLLRYIMTVAMTFSQEDPKNDYFELVGVGNLAAVECLDKALGKKEPVAYLKGCIKRTMKHSLLGQTYACPLEEDVADRPRIPTQRDYAWLYEALDKLAPQQIDLISQQFGLFGTKESLYAMSKGLSSNTKGTILYLRLYQALKRLRALLNNSLLVQTSGRPDEAS
jgi:hypothetical protein